MSQSMATIVVVGRLTRDAELKYTNGGEAVCHFSVATDARVKKGGNWVEEASFWDVDLWGKRGESLNQYLTKGKPVAVAGPVRIETWEQDGTKRTKVKINANDVQMLGSRNDGSGQAASTGQRQGGAQAAERAAAGGPDGDDIPF